MTRAEADQIMALFPGNWRKPLLKIHPDKVEHVFKEDALKALSRVNEANRVVGNTIAPTKAEWRERQREEDRKAQSGRDPRT